jgi:dienelactone hydrolase
MKKLFFLLVILISGCTTISPITTGDQQAHIAKKIISDKPRPTVLIAHGCDGVSSPSSMMIYSKWAEQLDSWGYNAVIVDSYSFRGWGHMVICENPFRVMPKDRADDLLTTAEYIQTQPWHKGKIGAIGFSHGGSTVLNLASRDQKLINVAVSYYPWCGHSYNRTNNNYIAKIPLQSHLAENDDWTPVQYCDYLYHEKEAYLYKGATHSFDIDYQKRIVLSHKLQYHPQAAKLSKERVKEFLDRNLQ